MTLRSSSAPPAASPARPRPPNDRDSVLSRIAYPAPSPLLPTSDDGVARILGGVVVGKRADDRRGVLRSTVVDLRFGREAHCGGGRNVVLLHP